MSVTFLRGKRRPLAVALDLKDAYNRVELIIFMQILKNMAIDPYVVMWIRKALLKSSTQSGCMEN